MSSGIGWSAGGRIPVIAVVGTCTPERTDYARRAARAGGHVLLSAGHLRSSPDAVEGAVALLRRMPRSPVLLVEYPAEAVATEVIGELADGAGPTALIDLIAVVDASHLLEDLQTDLRIPAAPPREEETARPSLPLPELLIGHIEYASTVVLTHAASLQVQQLDRIMAVISHLNPTARLDLDDAESAPVRARAREFGGGPVGDELIEQEQTRPGWISLLNGVFSPRFTHPEVTAVRYEQHRPMHPTRLAEVVRRIRRGDFGTVLRSAGFCHLASRAHVTAHWEQVGESFGLRPVAYDHQLALDDEPLAFGQDLAVTGLNLRSAALEQALDAAALTDAELIAGPRLWATFSDPFPRWEPAQG